VGGGVTLAFSASMTFFPKINRRRGVGRAVGETGDSGDDAPPRTPPRAEQLLERADAARRRGAPGRRRGGLSRGVAWTPDTSRPGSILPACWYSSKEPEQAWSPRETLPNAPDQTEFLVLRGGSSLSSAVREATATSSHVSGCTVARARASRASAGALAEGLAAKPRPTSGGRSNSSPRARASAPVLGDALNQAATSRGARLRCSGPSSSTRAIRRPPSAGRVFDRLGRPTRPATLYERSRSSRRVIRVSSASSAGKWWDAGAPPADATLAPVGAAAVRLVSSAATASRRSGAPPSARGRAAVVTGRRRAGRRLRAARGGGGRARRGRPGTDPARAGVAPGSGRATGVSRASLRRCGMANGQLTVEVSAELLVETFPGRRDGTSRPSSGSWSTRRRARRGRSHRRRKDVIRLDQLTSATTSSPRSTVIDWSCRAASSSACSGQRRGEDDLDPDDRGILRPTTGHRHDRGQSTSGRPLEAKPAGYIPDRPFVSTAHGRRVLPVHRCALRPPGSVVERRIDELLRCSSWCPGRAS